jgi:hypothetical protein
VAAPGNIERVAAKWVETNILNKKLIFWLNKILNYEAK